MIGIEQPAIQIQKGCWKKKKRNLASQVRTINE